jgi:hypothetical protein
MDSSDECEITAGARITNLDAPIESTMIPPPRLGIIHLLAWLTVAAALLGIERSARLLENAAIHSDKFVPHNQVLDTIHVIGIAAGVVGLAALIRWRVGGHPSPLAPGHWILIAEVAPMLLIYVGEIARRALVAKSGINAQTSYLPVVAITALTAMAQMFVFSLAGFRWVQGRSWQLVFRLLAVGSVSQMTLSILLFTFVAGWLAPPFPLVDFFYPAPAVIHGIVSSTTVAFAAYEAFRIRRDWLHGLGVAVLCVNGMTWVGYGIASQLFRLTSFRDCLNYFMLQ